MERAGGFPEDLLTKGFIIQVGVGCRRCPKGRLEAEGVAVELLSPEFLGTEGESSDRGRRESMQR